MEIRFFAPGGLVSNLDFVESIFGNAGDPSCPRTMPASTSTHWTGHTGCVILAPHLVKLTKKELGLPARRAGHRAAASRGQCWRRDEHYNDGQAFKITCRTLAGVMVTLIADNYFGYCKKEVKTQISFAANLFGNAEEEHAGGALAFASYNLGERVPRRQPLQRSGRTFAEVAALGAIDERPPRGIWHRPPVPADRLHPGGRRRSTCATQNDRLDSRTARRSHPAAARSRLHTPPGYKLGIEKHPAAPSWRLIGTVGRRHVLPQALHRLAAAARARSASRMRGLHAVWADLRGGPGAGPGRGRARSSARTTRERWKPDRPRRLRERAAAARS